MSDNSSTDNMESQMQERTSEKIMVIHQNRTWLSTIKWINCLNTEIKCPSNIPFVWEDFQKNIMRCAVYFYAKSHLSKDEAPDWLAMAGLAHNKCVRMINEFSQQNNRGFIH